MSTNQTPERPPFLVPPRFVGKPDPEHSIGNRAFQGVPSVAVTPKGRLWATWYAGPTPGEDLNNYVVLATSADDGRSWEEVLIIDPDGPGPVRAFDPELWVDPDGRLWSFWAQHIGGDSTIGGVWAMTADDPESPGTSWSAPRRLTDGVMMCKPLVLSSGEWMLPASTWRLTADSAKAVVSEDQGRTWMVRGACDVPEADRQFDEHMIVERKDGSLWMLVRTKYGIGESVSTDRGRTWRALMPSSILHTSSRFFIRRLESGRLLLIKHGPIGEKTGRSHLTAYYSEDDGATWEGGLLLDEREGISYPDGQQAADGKIYITYDYSRTGAREILLAAFTEEAVTVGKSDSGSVSLRQVISRPLGA